MTRSVVALPRPLRMDTLARKPPSSKGLEREETWYLPMATDGRVVCEIKFKKKCSERSGPRICAAKPTHEKHAQVLGLPSLAGGRRLGQAEWLRGAPHAARLRRGQRGKSFGGL
jgi:hypothetical protein